MSETKSQLCQTMVWLLYYSLCKARKLLFNIHNLCCYLMLDTTLTIIIIHLIFDFSSTQQRLVPNMCKSTADSSTKHLSFATAKKVILDISSV